MLWSCHVHVSEWVYTIHKCPYVKEFFARNRCDIWCSNDSIGIHNHLVRWKTLIHLAKLAKWLSGVVNTCLNMHLTVFYYHVMYAFQSESTVYSCLNVKELLSRNRHDIWRLDDSNGIRTHHQLVRKRTLNHIPKWVKWHAWIIRPICLNGWEFVYELSGCGFHIVTVT